MEAPSAILQLPIEVLDNILVELSSQSHSALSALSRTCYVLYTHALPYLFRHVDIHLDGIVKVPDAYLATHFRRPGDLEAPYHLNELGITKFRRVINSIKSIHDNTRHFQKLYDCSEKDPRFLKRTIPLYNVMQSLTVRGHVLHRSENDYEERREAVAEEVTFSRILESLVETSMPQLENFTWKVTMYLSPGLLEVVSKRKSLKSFQVRSDSRLYERQQVFMRRPILGPADQPILNPSMLAGLTRLHAHRIASILQTIQYGDVLRASVHTLRHLSVGFSPRLIANCMDMADTGYPQDLLSLLFRPVDCQYKHKLRLESLRLKDIKVSQRSEGAKAVYGFVDPENLEDVRLTFASGFGRGILRFWAERMKFSKRAQKSMKPKGVEGISGLRKLRKLRLREESGLRYLRHLLELLAASDEELEETADVVGYSNPSLHPGLPGIPVLLKPEVGTVDNEARKLADWTTALQIGGKLTEGRVCLPQRAILEELCVTCWYTSGGPLSGLDYASDEDSYFNSESDHVLYSDEGDIGDLHSDSDISIVDATGMDPQVAYSLFPMAPPHAVVADVAAHFHFDADSGVAQLPIGPPKELKPNQNLPVKEINKLGCKGLQALRLDIREMGMIKAPRGMPIGSDHPNELFYKYPGTRGWFALRELALSINYGPAAWERFVETVATSLPALEALFMLNAQPKEPRRNARLPLRLPTPSASNLSRDEYTRSIEPLVMHMARRCREEHASRQSHKKTRNDSYKGLRCIGVRIDQLFRDVNFIEMHPIVVWNVEGTTAAKRRSARRGGRGVDAVGDWDVELRVLSQAEIANLGYDLFKIKRC